MTQHDGNVRLNQRRDLKNHKSFNRFLIEIKFQTDTLLMARDRDRDDNDDLFKVIRPTTA